MFRPFFLSLSGALALGACQGPGGQQVFSAPQAPRTVELSRALRIPHGKARAYFQGGAQVGAPNRYEPYCELEVSDVSDGSLELEADRFAVTRVMQRRVADEASGVPAGIDIFGGSDIFHETHLWLSSAAEPEVRKLICRSWTQDAGRGRYLSVADMQAVLGPSFSLR